MTAAAPEPSTTPERARVRIRPANGFEAVARVWSERLEAPLAPARAAFELVVDGDGLGLRPVVEVRPPRPLRVDVAAARPGGEEVVRAVRGRRGVAATGLVVDASAGLGIDAAALARAGLEVVLIERDPLLHALLEDALARATASEDDEARATASRMRLVHGDARTVLPRLDPAPEVVYLDPMYPDLGGGAKRLGMRWVRDLLGEASQGEADDRALLDAARRAARRRVVLKRPAKAPLLEAGPSGSVRGRTTRFDLYAPVAPDER